MSFDFKERDDKLKERLANMTLEERKELASRMYNPFRCGGCGYDENGKIYYIIGGKPCNSKEVNDHKRKMNPKWSEEELKPYLLDEST